MTFQMSLMAVQHAIIRGNIRRMQMTRFGVLLAFMLSHVIAEAAPVADDGLTDEQRSAVKQNSDPVVSGGLKLSDLDMRWWRDAKFGMFIHWGLYAIPGEGEWYMHNKQMPAEEYAKLAEQFTGAKFDAGAWASAAKSAGMNYMVMV